MHPAVRLLCLMALSSALPAMSLHALAALCAAGILAYWRLVQSAMSRLASGVWRLRWLLLAIFVLYVGFTPGEPLLPALPGLSREGFAEGIRRALVLIDLLVCVYLLLAVTPVADLIGAIALLLAPLRILGVDPRRIGLRVALALEGVGEMQTRLKRAGRIEDGAWAARAARLIADIESGAEGPTAAVSMPPMRRPRWWEWLLPLALLGGLHTWTP